MPLKDHSINREAIKALVTVFGPNETSRQTGIPRGTVLSWCRRYKWKKALRVHPHTGINGGVQHAPRPDSGDLIAKTVQNHKEVSTVNLAHYVAKASKQAVKAKDSLKIARNVRDVAQVYRTLYPPEQGGELIEGAILVGGAAVRDNHPEMLATAEVIEDVRQDIPDQRPESD